MAGWKAAVAVALLVCLSFGAVDAASKQKKKAVVTHKVKQLIHTLPLSVGSLLLPCSPQCLLPLLSSLCRCSSTSRLMASPKVRQQGQHA